MIPFALGPLALLAAQVAPTIATWLSGPRAGEVAAAAGEVVRRVVGTDDPVQAGELLATDPAKAAELRQALAAIAAEQERAYLADVANARAQQVALAQAGAKMSMAPAYLTAALTLGFFGTIAAFVLIMVMGPADLPAGVKEVLLMLIGVLASEFRGSCHFWFGTTRSAIEMRRTLQAEHR